MAFEADQSGRIEETNRDTVIAIASKNVQFSLRISAKTKRTIERDYKGTGKPKLFAVKTFAIAVAFLIKKSKAKINDLIVDIEYPGHERIIKEIICEQLGTDLNIRFR